MDTVRASVSDHETRIRVNEKLGYKMLALSFGGAMIGGAAMMLITFLATQ